MSFFKKIFGPTKAEVWAEFATDMGGEIGVGGFWGEKHVKFRYKNWVLVLDTFTRSHGKTHAVYTRLRVPFRSNSQLRAKVYHEHFFFPVSKFFGAQDIQLGDKEFDKKFVVKASDEFQIIQLLNDIKLKALIMKLRKGYLEIKDKGSGRKWRRAPSDIDLLYFEALGVIKSKAELMDIFASFCALLDRAVHLNLIFEDEPGISVAN